MSFLKYIIPFLFIVPFLVSASCEVGGQIYQDGHPACASQDLANQQSSNSFNYNLQSLITASSFESLLVTILNTMLIFAIPMIVIFIIYAGFNYVMAQGNPAKIATATRQLTYALIGAVLILGAVALSQVVREIVCSFSSDPAACNSV